MEGRWSLVEESPWLIGLLVVAVAVRCGVAWVRADQLTIDRDAYLGIAENIVHRNGFCTPGSTAPTAYRPPMYPILLATTLDLRDPQFAVALWNILAGMWTIFFVDRIGTALGLEWRRHVATLLVAVDPLLLNATAQPMTECVFTALVTAWLWAVICPWSPGKSSLRGFWIGVFFGLAAMCRPTIWPLAGLMTAAWLCRHVASPAARRGLGLALARVVPIAAGILLFVVPWVVRNQQYLGRPIVTTTHGGYTLLLANNPVYFGDVVAQPWGTTWSGESLSRWQADVEQRMKADLGPAAGEVDRDAWMNAEAKRYIRQHPRKFLLAMWHRIRSLWSVVPRGEGSSLPSTVRGGVALFYLAKYLAAMAGLIGIIRRRDWPAWLPGLLLVVTVQGVHLVYWTDARMRTPLEPVLALLAARALTRGVRLLP